MLRQSWQEVASESRCSSGKIQRAVTRYLCLALCFLALLNLAGFLA